MDFSEYLKTKKIDPIELKKKEPKTFKELQLVFDQVHPDSFTQQKLFLINPLRRKYKWSGEEMVTKTKPKPMRPKIAKPKI